MTALWAIAVKDLRLLSRDKPGFFLAVLWPLLLAIFFGAVMPSLSAESPAFQAGLNELDQIPRPENPYALTFSQSLIWAVLACSATFGLSLAQEYSQGTMLRLKVGPFSEWTLLGGKAFACFLAIGFVQLLLLAIAILLFDVRASSWGLLLLSLHSVNFAFVGIMILIAVLARRSASASGITWAILMVLALAGGAMLPKFLMPPWMQEFAMLSPVGWGLSAIEGVLWQEASLGKIVVPCLALGLTGLLTLFFGTRALKREV